MNDLNNLNNLNVEENRSILQIQSLSLRLKSESVAQPNRLVDDVSIKINQGECIALVGESGSGKSLTALACVRLLPDCIVYESGAILIPNNKGNHFNDSNVLKLSRSELPKIRGKRIAFVFQEPSTALNPVMTIGEQLIETLRLYHPKLSKKALSELASQALNEVGILNSASRLNDYPLQFSGGQKQRVMLAMALIGSPDILIADEPTTALDVLIQAQILDLLKTLQRQKGMALLLITHDLQCAKTLADRVVVMNQGRIIDDVSSTMFFNRACIKDRPLHSQALLLAYQDDYNNGHINNKDNKATHNTLHPLLNIEGLTVKVSSKYDAYPQCLKTLFQKGKHTDNTTNQSMILNNIDLNLYQGQTLALLGVSGSGKTTLAKVLLGLQDKRLITRGTLSIYLNTNNHNQLTPFTKQAHTSPSQDWRRFMSIVFQDPYGSFNPRQRVGDSIYEGIKYLRPEWSKEYSTGHVERLMSAVKMDMDCLNRFPHEFSGGQRQRLAIVRALAIAPQLVILDEPTSALDATLQGELLNLLLFVQHTFNVGYLLITHHFQVVKRLAHHVAVLHQGKIIEQGTTQQVFNHPQHPHTRALINID